MNVWDEGCILPPASEGCVEGMVPPLSREPFPFLGLTSWAKATCDRVGKAIWEGSKHPLLFVLTCRASTFHFGSTKHCQSSAGFIFITVRGSPDSRDIPFRTGTFEECVHVTHLFLSAVTWLVVYLHPVTGRALSVGHTARI